MIVIKLEDPFTLIDNYNLLRGSMIFCSRFNLKSATIDGLPQTFMVTMADLLVVDTSLAHFIVMDLTRDKLKVFHHS